MVFDMKTRRIRKLGGRSETCFLRDTQHMCNKYPTCRPVSFIDGPVVKLPKILKRKCSITYEVAKDVEVDKDDDELYLTECDIDLLMTALDQYDENHESYPDKKSCYFIKKYLQHIKDEMVEYKHSYR